MNVFSRPAFPNFRAFLAVFAFIGALSLAGCGLGQQSAPQYFNEAHRIPDGATAVSCAELVARAAVTLNCSFIKNAYEITGSDVVCTDSTTCIGYNEQPFSAKAYFVSAASEIGGLPICYVNAVTNTNAYFSVPAAAHAAYTQKNASGTVVETVLTIVLPNTMGVTCRVQP